MRGERASKRSRVRCTVTREPEYDNNGYWVGYMLPVRCFSVGVTVGPWAVRTYLVDRVSEDCHLRRWSGIELGRNPVSARRYGVRWGELMAKRGPGYWWKRDHCKRYRPFD